MVVNETDVSPTLEAGAGGGGNNLPMVLACIEGNGSRPSHRGPGFTTETKVMYTLNSTEVHGVAYELPRENRIADGE